MMRRLFNTLRRFGCAQTGVAAIEFTFIAPVMLLSLFGAVEVSNAMLSDRKATAVASTLADLVSQDTRITDAEVVQIFDAGAAVLFPVEPPDLGMRVTSVVADSKGRTTVAWSNARGMGARAAGSAIAIPSGMVTPGGSVIYAEIAFSQPSMFGNVFAGLERMLGGSLDDSMKTGWSIADRFYLRPRRSITVTRSAT